MKSVSNIHSPSNFDVKRLCLYKEALYLFTLSRKLSNQHLSSVFVKCPVKNELAAILSEDISSSALTLPISIAEAAVTRDTFKKLYFQKTIEERIERILKLSIKLEDLSHSGDQGVQQLTAAARNFQLGFKRWSTHLTFQN